MDEGRPRFEADRAERTELAGRFLDAFRNGNVDRLTALLAADVQLVGDSGGKAPLWAERFVGAGNVARVLSRLVTLFARSGAAMEPREVNGQPGAIFRDADGKVLNTWTFEILDGRIQTIRTVSNPDKLGHVGPVADSWAALRAVTRPGTTEKER